ncbi:rhodanese-like domain-containing protein, partial [Enterococcus faecium]|uniref:sulfurtransferase n=1 Tax=Enterococcus faecium TaxID=1352 RepID=UPI003F442239
AVFDATYYLPGEGKDAASLFAAAHIPGAQFFDIDAVAEPGTSLPHMAPSARQFEAIMRAFGVNDGTVAVFYDQKGIFSAARGWWLMRL